MKIDINNEIINKVNIIKHLMEDTNPGATFEEILEYGLDLVKLELTKEAVMYLIKNGP